MIPEATRLPDDLVKIAEALHAEEVSFTSHLAQALAHGSFKDWDGQSTLNLSEHSRIAIERIVLDQQLRERFIDSLHPRTAGVLRSTYPKFLAQRNAEPKNFRQIGEEFGVVTQRISKIFDQAWIELGSLVRGYSLSIKTDDSLPEDLSFVDFFAVEND